MSRPSYLLCADGVPLAHLVDPVAREMFWWEYRVVPVSEEAAARLRDPHIWERVDYSVGALDGPQPNPDTFTGEHHDFCRGATDRLLFRSLPPPRASSS